MRRTRSCGIGMISAGGGEEPRRAGIDVFDAGQLKGRYEGWFRRAFKDGVQSAHACEGGRAYSGQQARRGGEACPHPEKGRVRRSETGPDTEAGLRVEDVAFATARLAGVPEKMEGYR